MKRLEELTEKYKEGLDNEDIQVIGEYYYQLNVLSDQIKEEMDLVKKEIGMVKESLVACKQDIKLTEHKKQIIYFPESTTDKFDSKKFIEEMIELYNFDIIKDVCTTTIKAVKAYKNESNECVGKDLANKYTISNATNKKAYVKLIELSEKEK